MKKFLLAIVFLMAPLACLADSGDTATVEMWQCELKEGKELDDVKANNIKWLANARKNGGSEEINSYLLETVVGDQSKFLFADVFPNMAVWSAVKSADSPEGEAIEAVFNELADCTKNRLYESTEH